MSGTWKNTKDKLTKNYQAEDRLLLIVLYGEHEGGTISSLQNKINGLRWGKGMHLENVKVISLDSYYELLGIDDTKYNLIKRVNGMVGLSNDDIMKLGENILSSPPNERELYLDQLEEIYNKAKEILDRWDSFLGAGPQTDLNNLNF